MIMQKHIKIEYDLISEMRKDKNTPVDTMGCHLFIDDSIDKNISNFHVIVGAFLSSQTKDIITYPAMQRLKNIGLTIDNILDISQDELALILKPVGFYNKKALMLKDMAKIIKQNYNNKPPISYNELVKLPGIGEKMACLIMNVINKKPYGICVDTHVHRITNRIGWVNTKSPKQTRKKLEEIIDKEYWNEINPLLVGFGQSICKSRKPDCDKCLLKDNCNYFINLVKIDFIQQKSKNIK